VLFVLVCIKYPCLIEFLINTMTKVLNTLTCFNVIGNVHGTSVYRDPSSHYRQLFEKHMLAEK